jgi:hypothetical protein
MRDLSDDLLADDLIHPSERTRLQSINPLYNKPYCFFNGGIDHHPKDVPQNHQYSNNKK